MIRGNQAPSWIHQSAISRAHKKATALNDSLAGNETLRGNQKTQCMPMRNWLLPLGNAFGCPIPRTTGHSIYTHAHAHARAHMHTHVHARHSHLYKYHDTRQELPFEFQLSRRCCVLLGIWSYEKRRFKYSDCLEVILTKEKKPSPLSRM